MSLSEQELADASFGSVFVAPGLFVRKLQLKFGGPFVLQLRVKDYEPTAGVFKYKEDFCSKEPGSETLRMEVSWPNGTCLDDKPVKTAGKPLNGSNACSAWQTIDHPLDTVKGRVVKYRLTALGGYGLPDKAEGGYNIFVQRHVTNQPSRNPGHTTGLRNYASIPHEMFNDIRAFWFLPSSRPSESLTLLRGMTPQEIRIKQVEGLGDKEKKQEGVDTGLQAPRVDTPTVPHVRFPDAMDLDPLALRSVIPDPSSLPAGPSSQPPVASMAQTYTVGNDQFLNLVGEAVVVPSNAELHHHQPVVLSEDVTDDDLLKATEHLKATKSASPDHSGASLSPAENVAMKETEQAALYVKSLQTGASNKTSTVGVPDVVNLLAATRARSSHLVGEHSVKNASSAEFKIPNRRGVNSKEQ